METKTRTVRAAVGDRVGAWLSADSEEVRLLGYGVRVEDEVPPADAGGFGAILHEIGMANPCVLLDNGVKVYGCECWWGAEEGARAAIGGRRVTEVDALDLRRSHRAPDE